MSEDAEKLIEEGRRLVATSPTVKPRDKLVHALRAAAASAEFIERAERGYYGDFTSPLTWPIAQLIRDAQAAGLDDIAMRAVKGEFDG